VHISGLEVREIVLGPDGICAPSAEHYVGLLWPGPKTGSEEAGLPSYAITAFTPAISKNSFSSGGSVRLIMSQKCPDNAGLLIGYRNTGLPGPDLRCLSAIH